MVHGCANQGLYIPTCKGKTMDMNHRHPLAKLIDEARILNGWSDQDIVNRAMTAGHKLSKANISRVRNSDVVAVNISFVNALSAGMGIPRVLIARAALAAAGIVIGVDNVTIEDAISRDLTLTLENKDTLRFMVKAMREAGNNAAQQKTGTGPNARPDTQKTGQETDATTAQKTDTPGRLGGGGGDESPSPFQDDLELAAIE